MQRLVALFLRPGLHFLQFHGARIQRRAMASGHPRRAKPGNGLPD